MVHGRSLGTFGIATSRQNSEENVGRERCHMADVMSVNNINVTHNANLPEWHSLDKNMTTEIVIMIVK